MEPVELRHFDCAINHRERDSGFKADDEIVQSLRQCTDAFWAIERCQNDTCELIIQASRSSISLLAAYLAIGCLIPSFVSVFWMKASLSLAIICAYAVLTWRIKEASRGG